MSEVTPEILLPIELDEQVNQLADWAATKHSDEADYHFFPHSWGVYEISMWLADSYEASGQKVDRRALAFAGIGHDIYAHLPISKEVPEGGSFESKEHRSAQIYCDYLVAIGYDEDVVAKPVYDLIISTKHGETCPTIESIILRMADIFNTVDSFEVFEERAQAFHRETCKFENKECAFEEWVPGAMNFLEGFIDPNLPKWFQERSHSNIAHLRTKYQVAA